MKYFLAMGVLLLVGMQTALAQTKPPAKAPIKSATVTKPIPGKATAAGGLVASISRGKAVYTQYCLTCHQVDGGGVPRMNPPLIGTDYVKGDNVRLIKVVLQGFSEKVEIEGDTYSNTMAPHNFLTDQQVADVLTYIRNSFGNKVKGIQPAQVQQVRASLPAAK
ncbi:Cytochrome c, mono-and diheme variants [Chitinophaga costaii]|uniref:Cytochrome c, mono-and diheme variants n=1 Tax=Chitinophaga costaii TaxID=1335309 RepID=A0A1C4FBJ1_9BACT|nr:cytochrome c [Chitinophaga costaii]PUZ20705.1 cytochrome C [Chitinophaga costaii]SCC53368.1 Cytochrome c, mono-and diheme variants [Chitinophaga costaii]